MKPPRHANLNEAVTVLLEKELPRTVGGGVNFKDLPNDAKHVVMRFLALLKRSACPVTEINAHMIWLLFTVTPSMLPSAWGGRIPPLTAPGRHKKIDAYVSGHPWPSNNGRPVLIDLGCGFPPLTTVDTAKHLPDWLIYGVDPSFSRYVVYDRDGRYACFDRNGTFQYFQSPGKPLNQTPEGIKFQFQSLFADLHSRLTSAVEDGRQAIEVAGGRLVVNQVREFETENLRLIKAGIEAVDLPPARFIRCMNMLLYFEQDARERMLARMARMLDSDGLLLVGFNHPFGIYARYTVYEKSASGIRPCEFAFSMDNLRPLGIGPWLALSETDNDAALLADLTRAIRLDRHFWPDFNRRVDHLREAFGICKRGDDGFNHFFPAMLNAPPTVMVEKAGALWNAIEEDGYKEGAISALQRAGYTAWKNQAGDIAVLPNQDTLDHEGPPWSYQDKNHYPAHR